MSTSLARRFKVDVSADAANWVPYKGITDFAPDENPTMVDSSTYDTNGFSSTEKTMTGWKAVIKANRQVNAGVFDPGQELARLTKFQFGDAARLYIRWYDRNNAPEAYQGRAVIDYSQSKTGVADLEEVTVTFNGDGIVAAITNPNAVATAPTVLSATPSGAAAGQQVNIQGAYFTGTVPTTGVKIGGVNATSWSVISDSLISAVVPTGSAGSAPIIVTNATGASAPLPYTRS